MSRPARSSSLMTTASASWIFSRKRTSIMQVSSGSPHMLTSNQRGRGHEPVTVLGRIRSAVAVNIWWRPERVKGHAPDPQGRYDPGVRRAAASSSDLTARVSRAAV